MTTRWRLRRLENTDAAAAVRILNHYVKTSCAAYAQHPVSVDAFRSLLPRDERYPAFVAESSDDELTGFAFLRPYSPYETFSGTALATYFIALEHTRGGLGTLFLDAMETHARRVGIDHLLAHVASTNDASLAFHRAHGFQQCGVFHSIGRKHERSFDVIWFEKRLPSDSPGKS